MFTNQNRQNWKEKKTEEKNMEKQNEQNWETKTKKDQTEKIKQKGQNWKN